MKSKAEQQTRVVLLENKPGRTEQAKERLTVKKQVHETLLQLREKYPDYSKEIAEEIKWMNSQSTIDTPFYDILTKFLDDNGRGIIHFKSPDLFDSKDNRAAFSRWLKKCMESKDYADIGNYRITFSDAKRPKQIQFVARKISE